MMKFFSQFREAGLPRHSVYRSAAGILLATAFILLVPLLAMQITDEVNWDPADFIVAGVLLAGTGLTFVLIAGKTDNFMYRAAIGITLVTALLIVWVNLAVGIIGSENNPANLMYFGVLAVGIIGAIVARFQPRGMWRALLATAFVQMIVSVIAMIAGLGEPYTGPYEIMILNGFFITLWVGAALLFRKASRPKAVA